MFSMAVAGLVKPLIAVTITLNPAAAHHGPGSYTIRTPGSRTRGMAANEADQPVPGRLDIGRLGRRVPPIVRHGSHPANRHTLQVKPGREMTRHLREAARSYRWERCG